MFINLCWWWIIGRSRRSNQVWRNKKSSCTYKRTKWTLVQDWRLIAIPFLSLLLVWFNRDRIWHFIWQARAFISWHWFRSSSSRSANEEVPKFTMKHLTERWCHCNFFWHLICLPYKKMSCNPVLNCYCLWYNVCRDDESCKFKMSNCEVGYTWLLCKFSDCV